MTLMEKLNQLIGGYFSDWTIQEGVEQLVFVSIHHPEYHKSFIETLQAAIKALANNDEEIYEIISNNNIFVANCEKAKNFLEQVLLEYIAYYKEVQNKLLT